MQLRWDVEVSLVKTSLVVDILHTMERMTSTPSVNYPNNTYLRAVFMDLLFPYARLHCVTFVN